MKISSIGSEAIQVQIDGEDYSVADIVHKELLGIKHVKFAGVAPPHPLIKTLTVQIHTDGGEPNELLKQAVTNAQEKTKEILDAAKKEFPDAVRPVRALPVSEHPVATPSPEPQSDQRTDVAETSTRETESSTSA
ncbi:MAG: RpoL/Rpb11 RNA polymerase subunit family protein [archaeon]|jgi:DNA-directed RNA polymerase subunit L|nr:RpoL/Rpb11 RNA polymerase subunit family protein [archaeon]